MEVFEIQRVESSKKIFACPFDGCSSVFDRPYRLAQHRLVHVNVKPFACTEINCEKAYTSKSHLDRHIKSVHKGSELNVLYCCPKCMKKYVNRQNLKRHMKVSHIDNNKPFCCTLCRIYFKKKHQFRAHMYIHNGIKPFRCPMCERDFITLYEKKKHMRNHKTYKCEHCEMKFTRWTELMQHKRVDHVSPEYICHDCEKVFKERGHIIRHVKKHMPNTPVTIFFCPHDNCFRHYSRNSNLKQHILVKHEGLTFDCSLCGAKLSTKAKLNEHIERHERPQIPVKVHKTLETGRKKRKDAGTIRYETAMRLAGIVKQKIEEGISRLYTKNMHYQDNQESNTTNTSGEILNDNDTVTDNVKELDEGTNLKEDVNKLSDCPNANTEIKVETERNSNKNENIFQTTIGDNTCQPKNDSRDDDSLFNGQKEDLHTHNSKVYVNQATNIIEILNRPIKNIDFQGQIESNIRSEIVDIQMKLEAHASNRPSNLHSNDVTRNPNMTQRSIHKQFESSTPVKSMTDFNIKDENDTQKQGYPKIITDLQGKGENAAQNMPSSSSTNALSTLLQLYWRTVLNYQDV